jgi:AraC-like DNA-binding protein
MPASIQTFIDPGEFGAAMCPSSVELIATTRGQFVGEIVDIKLPRLLLHRLRLSLPFVAHVQHPADRTYIAFIADKFASPLTVVGTEFQPGQVVQFGPAQISDQHCEHASTWANISFDLTDLDVLGGLVGTGHLTPPAQPRTLVPHPARFELLRKLHATAVDLARDDPHVLTQPETARALEQVLLQAMAACVDSSDQRPQLAVQGRHAVIVSRFRQLLDVNVDRALYVPEVCSALGVSHRTLCSCCHDFLGMSPKRYFFLRRMFMVRSALRASDPHTISVTDVATRYGFWELGRFAVRYKALFDENPSITLRSNSADGVN